MRSCVFLLALLGLVMGSLAAQYHSGVYVVGGNGRISTTNSTALTNGVYLADTNAQSYVHLTPGATFYEAAGLAMDRDNRHIVMAVQSPIYWAMKNYTHVGGLYRVDPAQRTFVTIRSGSDTYAVRDVVVNHDGDYVWTGSPQVGFAEAGLYKVSHDGKTQTTIMTTASLGFAASLSQDLDIDPATGGYLVGVSAVISYPRKIRNPVIVVQDDGTITAINDGSVSGYTAYYENRDLNWANQQFEGQYMGRFYQGPMGSGGVTTLVKLGTPGGTQLSWTGKFDLQSARHKQIVCHGTRQIMLNGLLHSLPVIFYIDRTTLTVTKVVDVDPKAKSGRRMALSFGFDFYRGRHISTTKTAPGKWDLTISIPDHAGKSYLAAVGVSGYHPGVQLADGRTIHLNPDALTALSYQGLLKPYFDGGPGSLNTSGEARGSIDLSGLTSPGIPLWIAVVVLDQGKIVYIPDTYVTRI